MVVEGDAESCVVVIPRGRSQQRGMERGHQPRDVSTAAKPATGGELKLDLEDGSRA